MSNVLLVYLFQENKSYGSKKPFAFILWCTRKLCRALPLLYRDCVTRFSPPVFCLTAIPGPSVHALKQFRFFQIFPELCDNFSPSPVSNNTDKVGFAVVLTLIRNYSLVSTTPVSDAFNVLESFTGVNNTIEEFLTASIQYLKNHPTSRSPFTSPVSTIEKSNISGNIAKIWNRY